MSVLAIVGIVIFILAAFAVLYAFGLLSIALEIFLTIIGSLGGSSSNRSSNSGFGGGSSGGGGSSNDW